MHEAQEKCVVFWGGGGGYLMEQDYLADLAIVGRLMLKWILKKQECGVWSVICL
jgi:hypothetical protein